MILSEGVVVLGEDWKVADNDVEDSASCSDAAFIISVGGILNVYFVYVVVDDLSCNDCIFLLLLMNNVSSFKSIYSYHYHHLLNSMTDLISIS